MRRYSSVPALRQVPIHRVLQGTDYNRKPFNPQNYPTSPAIEDLLSQPTWSVRALLPPSARAVDETPPARPDWRESKKQKNNIKPVALNTSSEGEEITTAKLHHLLKLSALPLPKSPEEEARMLSTLRSQVHFVRAIQSVDTSGVEPLVTIRDETDEAIKESTITLEKMMPYLELEEKVGRNGTVRRRDVVRTPEEDSRERATWEVDVGDLGVGSEKRRRGKWFYVKRARDRGDVGAIAGESELRIVGDKKDDP